MFREPPRDPSPAPVAAIVLAAGMSTRMGRNKLLLDLDGEPLLRRVVRRSLDAGLEPVVVVLGHDAERTAAALDGLPCRTVVNGDYREGTGTSLKTGLAALPAGTPAVVSLLADMPHVTSAMLATLVEMHRDRRAPLVVSDYGGVTAPPYLFDRELFPQIAALPGHCNKRVVKRNRERAAVARWPAEALADVDEPADLEAARTRIAAAD